MLLEAQKGNAEIIGKAVALLRGKVPEGKSPWRRRSPASITAGLRRRT
jgi:hypothetical protein